MAANEQARDRRLSHSVEIRPLREQDLEAADHVMRLAFGTYLGVPQPLEVFGDADYVHTRYRADPTTAFAADVGGELVGSNFAARWGSLAFFGPLTVRPDHWDRGIASRLMEPVVDLFDGWGIRLSGLFTFPGSTKHLGLYQKFGFWPQHVSAVMAREVAEAKDVSGSTTFTEARKRASAEEILDRCRRVTDTILPGLDLRREIDAVAAQDLGDTVLVEGDGRLGGFAVCHCGARTEAGSGACFIKFAAVSPGPDAAWSFEQLIQACEAMAAQRALPRLIAGVNTGCHDAYRILLERGFRANLIGLTMLRPNEPGYPPSDAYVISDLR